MNLKEKLEYDLNNLVKCISSIDDVIAIILFGSIAKGEYDEYSDYDLLVILKDKESLWKRWNELFKKVGELNLLIHCIPKSLDEFLNSEPIFLTEILKNGKLLYSKYPFQAYMKPINLKHMKLIIYNLSKLNQKDKMKIIYKLHGKGNSKNRGIINKVNGIKLNDGCILIPEENSKDIIDILKKYGAEINIIDTYCKTI